MRVWTLVYEGFDPGNEGLREALCTLGNGYFATRGAAPESDADETHYPGTYMAGGYNRLQTDVSGRTVENEDLVNLPNWLPLRFSIEGGGWFRVEDVQILAYRQELDIRRGILSRTIRFRDAAGRTTKVSQRRVVHMSDPHLAGLEMRIVPEDWSGRITVRSSLDGRVVNGGVRRYQSLNNRHLVPLEARELSQESLLLAVETSQSRIGIAQAARTRIFKNEEPFTACVGTSLEEGLAAKEFEAEVTREDELCVEKIVALYSSRDSAICEARLEAEHKIAAAPGFHELALTQERRWDLLWRRFEIAYRALDWEEGDRTSLILHLYVFHQLQATSLHTMDLDTGVPSRGWHGEAYRGHIFWDELYIFPMLNLRVPEITRSLLMYRYRRLNTARDAARAAGYRGAMYPWQSGSNGREESQRLHLNPRSGRWVPDNTYQQRHINAAIVYNIWQYYQATRDLEFLSFYGAEMVLEIARFWASIAAFNPELDRYEILGVMGPDEYHDAYPGSGTLGVNNNAYTNVMAVWVLNRAVELFEHLPEETCREICTRLELDEEEIDLWRDLSRKMRVPFHGNGIISQFEGYEDLLEFDWEGYRERYGDIQRLDRILEAEGDTPNRYKASKQADVLMLFYLFSSEELRQLFEQLGYRFEYETIPRNIEYYMQRTSHGSTLSRVVHSWVLSRSDRERAWQLFVEALQSDVADIQGGTTPEGIHLGAMAGTVDIMQRGFTGIEMRENVLRFNPVLPKELADLTLRLRYRGLSLRIELTPETLTVEALRGAARSIYFGIRDEVVLLEPGGSRSFDIRAAAAR
jgi:alpha,alpha-trehalase